MKGDSTGIVVSNVTNDKIEFDIVIPTAKGAILPASSFGQKRLQQLVQMWVQKLMLKRCIVHQCIQMRRPPS